MRKALIWLFSLSFISLIVFSACIPLNPPEKKISEEEFSYIAGLSPQEKLQTLLDLWNQMGAGEYKVGGYYEIIKDPFRGDMIVIKLQVSLHFGLSMDPGQVGRRVNTILGRITTNTAKVFDPTAIVLSTINLLGPYPRGEILVYLIPKEGVEALKTIEMLEWTKYAVVKPGSIATPEEGPVIFPGFGGQDTPTVK